MTQARLRCPACGNDMPASRRICEPCTNTFLRDLAAIPGLVADLDLAITRQVRLGGGGGGGEPAVAWDDRASRVAAALRSTLVGWVRVLRDSVVAVPAIGPRCSGCRHRTCMYWDLAQGPADTVAAMARWLARHHRALIRHPAAGEAVSAVRGAVRDALHVIDRPDEQTYAGPCPGCGSDLYARPGTTGLACPTCERGVNIDEQHTRLRGQLDDQLAHAAAVGAMLRILGRDVADSTIRYWAQRGRLVAHGRDPMGRPLYRVGDVERLLAE